MRHLMFLISLISSHSAWSADFFSEFTNEELCKASGFFSERNQSLQASLVNVYTEKWRRTNIAECYADSINGQELLNNGIKSLMLNNSLKGLSEQDQKLFVKIEDLGDTLAQALLTELIGNPPSS